MSSKDDGNGEHGIERRAVDTLVLTYDSVTDHLDVAGKCHSLDLMLDMLHRATRVLESRWRVQQMLEHQRQMAEQARAAAIAAGVKGNMRA